MTNQLETLIAEMKAAAEKQDKYLKGGAFSIDWDEYITPKNVLALIEALEQSQCEQNNVQSSPALYLCRVFRDGEELYSPCGKDYPRGRAYYTVTSQVAVKLDSDKERDPEVNPYDGENFYISGWNARGKADREKLRAAGITVQGDE